MKMEKNDWINLNNFGASLKRLNMPNGGSVPIVIVHDIEKYNASGATPLSQFKDDSSDVPFKRLPGDKKGREFNQPILYMTKSFKELGESNYKVIPSLAKLLKISEDEVRANRMPMLDSEINSENEYADFSRFSSIIDSCHQAYAGSIIYEVKDRNSSPNLIDLAEDLQGKQHALFPKSNLENIPFETLDSLGLDSSIVSRGFLNPSDALKAGYRLSDLNKIHLQGDVSILPISINNDLSLNFINNVADLSQLAYSNYKWQKNIGMVNDYQALVAVRESSRNILNARPSSVRNTEEMERLISDLSTTLQNFNESNNIQKTHKTIKYFNNGVTTHLIKNDQNEWRYIEKDGSKKIDQPLTWENYQKAITTLANYNTIITSALQLQVKQGVEFDNALNTVFNNHQKIYKANTLVVENVSDIDLSNKLIININGQKVSKERLARFTNDFDRDMGHTLYTETVKQMLSGMREIENAGDINNVVGGRIVDDYEVINNATVVPNASKNESLADVDIGLSILDNFQKDEVVNLDLKLDQEKSKLTIGVDLSMYADLPKSINPLIDANYDMANDIYKTLQHMELSEIPWYENATAKIKQEIQELSAAQNHDLHSGYADYLKHGDASLGDAHIAKQNEHQAKINALNELDQYSGWINQTRTQSSILRYQFNKLLGDQRASIHGMLAFKADKEGNYIPFADKFEYQSVTQQLKNQFLQDNVERGRLIDYRGPIKEKLNSFVVSHFNINDVDFEQDDAARVERLSSVKNDLTILSPNFVETPRLPISKKDNLVFQLEILDRVEDSLKKYSDSPDSAEPLNNSLIAIARMYKDLSNKAGVEVNPTAIEQNNQQLKEFLKFEGSLNYPIDREYMNISTGVPVSDIQKIDLLKSVVERSFSSLWNDPEFDTLTSVVPISKLFASATNSAQAKVLGISQKEYQQELAGKFLISHQYSTKDSIQKIGVGSFLGYTVGSHPDNFKVRLFKDSERTSDVTPLDYSRTYSSGVQTAFKDYQLHDAATKLGIDGAKLQNIKNLATINQAINAGRNVEHNSELSKSIFGYDLSAKDLSSLHPVPSKMRDNLGNKLMQLQGDDIGVLTLSVDTGMKLMASASIVNKLSGVESKFHVSPLVENIGDLTEFSKVQSYLQPDAHELGFINTKIHVEKDREGFTRDLAAKLSKFAYMQYEIAKAEDILINPESISLATTTPMQVGDGVFSRVIPSSWKMNLVDSNAVDYNVTPIKEKVAISQNLLDYAADHLNYGSDYNYRTSSPVFDDPAVQNQKVALTLEEKNVLEGGLSLNDGSEVDQYIYRSVVAATNFQVAMNNMPDQLKQQLQEYINGNDALHDTPVRVSMKNVGENKVPRLSLGTLNTEFDANETYIMRLNLRDLTEVMTSAGYPLEKYDGQVALQGGELCTKYHDRCLNQLNFDLMEYARSATIRNGNHDFKLENPLERVDQLQPIQFRESDLSFNRLAYSRNIFAELLPKSPTDNPQTNLDAVDSAKVFVRADGENVAIALAHSAEMSQKYIDDNYLAVYQAYKPIHQPHQALNALSDICNKNLDIEDRNKIVEKFFDIVDEAAASVDATNTQPVASIEATPELIQNVAESISNEKSENAPMVKTEFVEKLNAYSLDQLQAMHSAELSDKVTISNIWPTESLEKHLESNHQRLDTLLLTKTLRDVLNAHNFPLSQNSSIEKDAMDYQVLVSEIHNAVSKAQTPEDLLVNFDKAYKNVITRAPEYFTSSGLNDENSERKQIIKDFQGAAYNHVYNEMSASDALKLALADSPFAKQYQVTAQKLGHLESLYSNEKSFANYMDGFTLNASGRELDVLNSALIHRFANNRLESDLNLDKFETTMSIVDKDIVANMDAKNRLDVSEAKLSENLSEKWGVRFEVANSDAQFTHGYSKLADQMLDQLRSNFPENTVSCEAIGRGMTIQAGQPHNLDEGKDLYITSVQGGFQDNYKHFSNSYAYNLIKAIEEKEVSLMNDKELSAYSGANEYNGGLIKQAVDMGYEPKTLAGQKLLEIHGMLKDGLSGQVEKPSDNDAFLEQSRYVTNEKLLELRKLHNDSEAENIHAARYANYFADMMSSRQDIGLKQLEERVKKLGSANLNAEDLYHFTSAVKMLDKVSNTSAISSKSAIEKFIEQHHGKESNENKQEIISNIQVALDNKDSSIVAVQDYLESRASNQFIAMMAENAPTSIKGTDAFPAEVIKYFGARLGDNAQEVERPEYLSGFGHEYELNQKQRHLFSQGVFPEEINKDQLVFSFVSAMTNPDPTKVHAAELEQGVKSVAELIQSHYQDIKPDLDAKLTLTKENNKVYEQDNDNRNEFS